jgi:hypothetical protein
MILITDGGEVKYIQSLYIKPDSFEDISIDRSTVFKVVADETWCDGVEWSHLTVGRVQQQVAVT